MFLFAGKPFVARLGSCIARPSTWADPSPRGSQKVQISREQIVNNEVSFPTFGIGPGAEI
jgi:hypothetical protein